MPTARLSVRFLLRSTLVLIVGLTILALLASLAPTQKVAACGGPPPRPLRVLYLESDRIVVAHVGETIPLSVSFEYTASGNYRKYAMKTTLHVTSTIKGEGDHYTINVYHDRWVWSDPESQEGQSEQHDFSEYKSDDTLLVFLQLCKDGEGYRVSDTTYAIKKLSDDDLKTYIQRINELAEIMQPEQPDNGRLVEWLVRCAEEPATRWEGAFELANSNSAMYDRDESEASEEQSQESGETAAEETPNVDGSDAATVEASVPVTTNDSDGAIEMTAEEMNATGDNVEQAVDMTEVVEHPLEEKIAAKSFMLNNSEFVKLLTVEQKNRLAEALFKTKVIEYNEYYLLELIKHWDEPRLVPFLISYLHTVTDDPPYMAQSMVALVAEKLNNKDLIALAEYYSENAAYGDEPDESNNDAPDADAQADMSEIQKANAREEKALHGTRTQKRSARLRRFLASADSAPSS